MRDVYEDVTTRMLDALRGGTIPWRKPWDPTRGQPRNFISGRAYNGINVLLLGLQGRASPYWLTYRQALEAGGQVRAGEKGTRIVFWKPTSYTRVDPATGEPVEHEGLLTRTYVVFNVEQCDGLQIPKETVFTMEGEDAERCERFVRNVTPAPRFQTGGDKAYFYPALDYIQLPALEAFSSYAGFAATQFHEMVHWTGHPSRLDRATLRDAGRFGDENYSKEELVAEIGSGFLCAMLGVENANTWQNSVAYVQNWLAALKADRTLVVGAAQQATKAVNYLSGTVRPNAPIYGEVAEAEVEA